MIRLITFIVIFVIFLFFIVFNLGNKSDVSFGFTSFKDIPVFVTAFSSFVLGMLFTLPFMFSRRKGWKKPPADTPENSSDAPEGKKKRRGRRNKNSKNENNTNDTVISGTDEIKKEDSPYGVD